MGLEQRVPSSFPLGVRKPGVEGSTGGLFRGVCEACGGVRDASCPPWRHGPGALLEVVFSLTLHLGEQSWLNNEKRDGSVCWCQPTVDGGGPMPLSARRQERTEGALPHLPVSPLPWNQGKEVAYKTRSSSASPSPEGERDRENKHVHAHPSCSPPPWLLSGPEAGSAYGASDGVTAAAAFVLKEG